MEKFDAAQLDLFAQNQDRAKRSTSGAGFLLRLRAYERILLLAIGFIITGVIAFAFGVERGRHSAGVSGATAPSRQVQPRQVPPLESRMQAAPAALRQPAPKAVPFMPQKEQPPVSLVKAPLARQGYTIQLATFKSHDFAQQEADKLRKLGYQSAMVTSGSYVVLCVGNFSDKESAKAVLTELTKKYQGCFLRRI